MSFEIHPKSTTYRRGLAYYKNPAFAPGQPCVIANNGIGERNDESANATGVPKNANWAGWSALKALADKYQFNIILTNTNIDNDIDNIEYAFEMAAKDLQADMNRVRGIGLSWGGRRWYIWLGANPENAKRLSGLAIIAPGSYDTVNASKYIAAAKLPVWWHHKELDPVTKGPAPSETPYLRVKGIDANAPVYYTRYEPDSNAADDHNLFSLACSLYLSTKVDAQASLNGYALTDKPLMNIGQWWQMNESFGPTDPEQPFKEPSLQTTTPEPEKPVTLIGIGSAGPIECVWSDGSKTLYKAATDDKMWAYYSLRTNTLSLDHNKAGVQHIDLNNK